MKRGILVREILLTEARNVALKAYAPYSNFRVGAALRVIAPDGTSHIVTGVNVENASFGLTLCAERNALASACTSYCILPQTPHSGHTAQRPTITHLAVACIDAPPDAPANEKTPCGACRQWFAELAPDAIFYVDGIDQDLRLDDLLPLAFRLH
jgi:cytidine deaminase